MKTFDVTIDGRVWRMKASRIAVAIHRAIDRVKSASCGSITVSAVEIKPPKGAGPYGTTNSDNPDATVR